MKNVQKDVNAKDKQEAPPRFFYFWSELFAERRLRCVIASHSCRKYFYFLTIINSSSLCIRIAEVSMGIGNLSRVSCPIFPRPIPISIYPDCSALFSSRDATFIRLNILFQMHRRTLSGAVWGSPHAYSIFERKKFDPNAFD